MRELIARDGPYRRLMGPQLAEPSRDIVPLPLADMPIGDADAAEETGARGARPRAGRRGGRLAGDHRARCSGSSVRGGGCLR